MQQNSGLAKGLRFLGIVLMALTAGFTLLGGVGTSCVAFNPTGFSESMAKLAPMQWLYILFVLTGIALGVLGIRATVMLVKGKPNAYQQTLLVLAAGVVIGLVHIFVSRSLRGASMPVDAVVYTTVLTLIVFLIFRIPGVWQGVDYTKAGTGERTKAGGAAAIVLGLFVLSIQHSMAPTHTWDGVNYAAAFHTMMTILALTCLTLGAGLLLYTRRLVHRTTAAMATFVEIQFEEIKPR